MGRYVAKGVRESNFHGFSSSKSTGYKTFSNPGKKQFVTNFSDSQRFTATENDNKNVDDDVCFLV